MLSLTHAQLEALDEIFDRMKALAVVDNWPSARAEFLQLQARLNDISPPAMRRSHDGGFGGFSRAGF